MKIIILLLALFLVLCAMTHRKIQVVQVPVFIKLDEKKYKIIRKDTLPEIFYSIGDSVRPIATVRYIYQEK